jgi:hypothetical protein
MHLVPFVLERPFRLPIRETPDLLRGEEGQAVSPQFELLFHNLAYELDDLIVQLRKLLLIYLSGEKHGLLLVFERHQLGPGFAGSVAVSHVQSADLFLLVIGDAESGLHSFEHVPMMSAAHERT